VWLAKRRPAPTLEKWETTEKTDTDSTDGECHE